MEQSIIELLQQYGYIGIFLFLMLGIVGIPLPDEIMMTFIGYLASVGKLNLYYTFISAFLGSICGITFSYVLGMILGYSFLKKYGSKILITQRRLEMSQQLFQKYGNWLLFLGYFIPGVRHVTAYLAGILQMSVLRFIIFAYGGAVVWCAVFLGFGHMLGANWELLFTYLHQYGLKFLLLLLPFIASFIIWIVWNQNQRTLDSND